MHTVKSKDGTVIAYDKSGQGPVVILVDGAFGTRAFFGPTGVVKLLAPNFTAILYDRRGRGDSSDTAPYAIEREVEDIQALIEAEGGSAYVYGISSGAVLAMYAAGTLASIKKIAVFEPPLILDGTREPVPADTLDKLKALIAAGKPGDAVKLFIGGVMGAPAFALFVMQLLPFWPKMKSVAHTTVYDLTIMGDFTIAPALAKAMSDIKAPTLVMGGGKSPDWMQHTAQVLAGCIEGATLKMLDKQTHEVDPKVVTPALIEFFSR